MTLDPSCVQTITFDSYSTLVDPLSARCVLEGYVDDPDWVASRWHTLAVQYATVANYLDTYRTYYDLHRDALAYLLESRGVDVSEAELTEMTDIYYDLKPFDDVRRGMERLADAGYTLAILSNGDPEMLESLVETTETDDLLETTVSAEEIETFKPDARLYEHAADRLDTPIDELLHVGAGWGDIIGCTHAGAQSIWLNRKQEPWPRFDVDPDVIVESMDELVNIVITK